MRFHENDLEQAMRKHDWYYQSANDPHFTQGKFERDHIVNLMKMVGEEKSRELWETYAPGIQRAAFPAHLFKS